MFRKFVDDLAEREREEVSARACTAKHPERPPLRVRWIDIKIRKLIEQKQPSSSSSSSDREATEETAKLNESARQQLLVLLSLFAYILFHLKLAVSCRAR